MHYLIVLILAAGNVRANDLPKAALDSPDAFFDQRATAPASAFDQAPPVAAATAVPAKPHPVVAYSISDPANPPASTSKRTVRRVMGDVAIGGFVGGLVGLLLGAIMMMSLPHIAVAAAVGAGIGGLIGLLAGLAG